MPSVRFCNKDSAEVGDMPLTSDNSNDPSSSFQHSSSGDPPSSIVAPSIFSMIRVTALWNLLSSTTQSVNCCPTDGADTGPCGIVSTEATTKASYTPFPPCFIAAPSKFSFPCVTVLGKPSSSTVASVSNCPTNGADSEPGITLTEGSNNDPTNGTTPGPDGFRSTEPYKKFTSRLFQPTSSAAPSLSSVLRLSSSGNQSFNTMLSVSMNPTLPITTCNDAPPCVAINIETATVSSISSNA